MVYICILQIRVWLILLWSVQRHVLTSWYRLLIGFRLGIAGTSLRCTFLFWRTSAWPFAGRVWVILILVLRDWRWLRSSLSRCTSCTKPWLSPPPPPGIVRSSPEICLSSSTNTVSLLALRSLPFLQIFQKSFSLVNPQWIDQMYNFTAFMS